MIKTVSSLFAVGLVMVASSVSAAYNSTSFSAAGAEWVDLDDGAEYDTYWTSFNSNKSCGTGCSRYGLVAFVGDSSPYKLSFLYARVKKAGTDRYPSSDWDFRTSWGGWGGEDSSSDKISGRSRLYSAQKDYGSSYLAYTYDHEIRFDFTYADGSSGQRQFNFDLAYIN